MSDHLGGLARSARGEGAGLLPVAVPVFIPPGPRTPALSLDDYLRRREGGGGR